MTLLAALLLGLLVGTVLGTLGGGGAILTVPLLVYLLGQSGQEATASSLVIVGVTALVGTLGHSRAGHVRWRPALILGGVGAGAAAVGTEINSRIEESALLLGFAGVMLLAALAMTVQSQLAGSTRRLNDHQLAAAIVGAPGPARTGGGHDGIDTDRHEHLPTGRVLMVGLAVGLLTGIFGVGGGFVIVPALVLVLGMPMRMAAGTSLVIIAINSAASLVARAGSAHFDWEIIIPFTLAAMVASLAGGPIADRVPGHLMQRGFAMLLLGAAGYVAARVLVL